MSLCIAVIVLNSYHGKAVRGTDPCIQMMSLGFSACIHAPGTPDLADRACTLRLAVAVVVRWALRRLIRARSGRPAQVFLALPCFVRFFSVIMAEHSACAAIYTAKRTRVAKTSSGTSCSASMSAAELRQIEERTLASMKRFAGIKPEALLKVDNDGKKLIDYVRELKTDPKCVLRQTYVLELWQKFEAQSNREDLSAMVSLQI